MGFTAVELESEFRIAVIVKMLNSDNYGDCCQVVSKADEALKNAERSSLDHRFNLARPLA